MSAYLPPLDASAIAPADEAAEQRVRMLLAFNRQQRSFYPQKSNARRLFCDHYIAERVRHTASPTAVIASDKDLEAVDYLRTLINSK